MHHPITVVEFCAGYCGLGLGLQKVLGDRMRTIGYCELEGFAQANLISKMEAGLLAPAPLWPDLRTFPYDKFRGLVDFAVAGIPCQPHSTAGKRAGGSDDRFLFDEWLAGLERMRPGFILIENVEGLLSSKMPDGQLCIAWTVERLEGMGYAVEAGIFSAAEVGAPHQRKRVFIMAHDKQQGLERYSGHGAIGDQQGWFAPQQNGSTRPGSTCILANASGWSRVSFASDCKGGDGNEPGYQCSICDGYYPECKCPGPTQDGFEYHEFNRELYARPKKLANTRCEQPQGWNYLAEGQQFGAGGIPRSEFASRHDQVWPSRPGEPQHGWEPPRVVGNTTQLFSNGGNDHRRISERPEAIPELGDAGGQIPRVVGDATGNGRKHDQQCEDRRQAAAVAKSGAGMGDTQSIRSAACRPKHEGLGGKLCAASASGEGTMVNTTNARQSQRRCREMGQSEAQSELERSNGNPHEAECQIESAVGRDSDGPAGGLGYAELYVTCDNRTDELRLLGNGVVPATAEKAIRTLLQKHFNK